MTDIAALEWQLLAKLGVGFLCLLAGLLGLVVVVVKWQLGSLREGLSVAFQKINDQDKRLRAVEHIALVTNPDSTIVQRAITGGSD